MALHTNFKDGELFKMHYLIACLDQSAEQMLLDAANLTYSQFLILMMVESCPDFNQKCIASHLHTTESAVSRQVDKLCQAEYLTRADSPNSRRERMLVLTSKGNETLAICYEVLNQGGEQLMSCLSIEERKTFSSLTSKLIDYFHATDNPNNNQSLSL